MIKASNITFTYGIHPLYQNSSFTIGDGTRVGLVGRNGTGKSTLLRVLSGLDSIDGGKLIIEGRVAYVPQEIKHDPILDAAPSIRAYIDPDFTREDAEILGMMRNVDIGDLSLDLKPTSLSGGQKTRLALLRGLIQEPDISLLDEPTNFMDTKGKQWVMNFLSNYSKTFILVSHDLDVIDPYIDKVIAINEFTKQIEEYNGNYSKYIKLKKLREARMKRGILTQERKLKHMKKGVERMQRFTSKKGERQRAQLKKKIQKIQDTLPKLPPDIASMKFRLPEPTWTGELPVLVKNISKSYGEVNVISDLSFSIKRGERVPLIGQNGVGKSTLIKMISGEIKSDTGRVELHENVKLGYYSQEFETFDREQTLLEFALKVTNTYEQSIRPMLAGFMFSAQKIQQKIETLSGGEKTRYAIALIMLRDFNMLILDEPTTYLDVLSQRLILEAIKQYKGTLLVVSHTEDFIRELKPDKAILLPEEKCVLWDNKYLERVVEM